MKSIRYFVFFIVMAGCLQSGVEQVRIVDENGKPVKINKTVPKFNEEQMIKQREAFKNKDNATQINKFRQDYNDTSDTFSRSLVANDSNIIVPIRNYPDDIFADRITNYNYIEDTNKTIMQAAPKKADNRNVKAPVKKNMISVKDTEVIGGDILDSSTTVKAKKRVAYALKTMEEKPLTVESQKKSIESKSAATLVVKSTAPRTNVNQKGYYIQVGVYREKKNADSAYEKYSKISSGNVEEYDFHGSKKYKVLLGPFSDKKTAEQSLEKIIKMGHYDVYITEKK